MGRFFTSTQINNPKQLDCDGFKAYFCEKMKKDGYEVCDADSAELSYVLAFADNCKWVTISSESYEQGNRTAQADTARIAKMLKTTCINTTVIDSDCAMLDLYDDKGKKVDTSIMGSADDYLGDDIPVPAQVVWEQFISAESTWEKFMSVVQGDYVFIEDGLSELAPVIGMDNGNILFEYEDADESNEKICYLSFRKASSKKEKKLTLNAAFKQVFGELLEPMGFKLIKSKYPYYLRVVGEGIIQAISFAKKKSLNLDLNRDEEEVEIYVGISLLSNPLINFDKNPTIIDNQVWMISLNELYRRFIVYMDGFNRKHEEYSFFYQKGNIEEVLNALKQSRDELMPFVLEFLEKPKTLEDIYRLGEITRGIRYDTIILLQKIDELIKELKENLTKSIEMVESVHKDNPERLEYLKKRHIEGSEKSIKYFESFKKGGEKYDDYIKTAEKTKEDNLEKLKQLGIL